MRRPSPGRYFFASTAGTSRSAARAARRCRCCTGWRARAGCVSAPTIASVPRGDCNSLIDAKAVIAWARTHASEHGADSSLIVVAGGSAGGHLASMAALTPNHPAFQPPGGDVDTTVAAAICLYGYYGRRTSGQPASSPQDYITREAPSFLIAAGDDDNQIDVSHADQFVERLRGASAAPVVYFRLPARNTGSTCSDRCASSKSSTGSWPSSSGCGRTQATLLTTRNQRSRPPPRAPPSTDSTSPISWRGCGSLPVLPLTRIVSKRRSLAKR